MLIHQGLDYLKHRLTPKSPAPPPDNTGPVVDGFKACPHETAPMIMQVRDLSAAYGDKPVLRHVDLPIWKNKVTALIGPSGCGKSTLLCSLNRLQEVKAPSYRISGGQVLFGEDPSTDIYAKETDPVALRRVVGMVFQKPNPFPKSIYDNVAFGARVNGFAGDMDQHVQANLKKAALDGEVGQKLQESGLSLSGGQQQRLCLARALAVDPSVLLMDEPCSALDPISTKKVEDLIGDLKQDRSIVMVTHSMAQAERVSDYLGVMWYGELVAYGPTAEIFEKARQGDTSIDQRVRDYVLGKVG